MENPALTRIANALEQIANILTDIHQPSSSDRVGYINVRDFRK